MRPRWQDERGVALLTVVLVAAALLVLSTAGSVIAVGQLRAGQAATRGSEALAHAEAGLQRFLRELKMGNFGLGAILTAGCSTAPVTLPTGRIGSGTYSAELTVYDADASPQVPPAWTGAPTAQGPCTDPPGTTPARFPSGVPSPSPRVPYTYAITATGTSNTGRRVIRAIVTISGAGLPRGVFVNQLNANGNPGFDNISLFSKSDIYGREKLGFTGTDLQYTLADVYGPSYSATTFIPTAAHSVGAIYLKANGRNTREHPPQVNCTANPRGTAGQSRWDGSVGGSGPITTAPCGAGTYPPTSLFTAADFKRVSGDREGLPQLTEAEYASLKANAQTRGIYCSIPATGTASCTKYNPTTGLVETYSLPGTVVTNPMPAGSTYVAYFEYAAGGDPSTRSIKWNAAVSPCSNVPASNNSATIVVRNGGLDLRSNATMYGSAIAPEGVVDVAGGFTLVGSVIANEVRLRGNSTFKLDTCSQTNAPAASLNVTGGRWSEIDRI